MTSSSSNVRPLVSVVTPFYNTDVYIAQCIESVLSQTYTNFEYVLIDNQSTDRSFEIANSYAGKDSRIRLLRTPRFFTQMQNASFALEQCDPAAAYCKIVFADDWLDRQCLDQMVTLAEAHPGVGIVGSYYVWGHAVAGLGLDAHCNVFSGKEACRRFLLDGVFPFGSPSTVLYRASLVRAHTPFFADGHLHEDTEAVLRLLREHDFGFVHQILAFLRFQEESITHSARDFNPEALDGLIIVRKFGRFFLDDAEYDVVLKKVTRSFYRGLAKQWIADRVGAVKRGFWEYQARGLETIGEKIQPRILARHLVGGLLEGIIRSADAMRTLKTLLPFKRAAGSQPSAPSDAPR
jgi:glycosyltransferase involved in cell wall biosynthesis